MSVLKKVLIVDDDPILRTRVGAYYVDRHQTTVVEAGNGLEALKIVQSGVDQFDLILFDLNMPEADGIEFLTALARANYAGAVAIISGEILATIEMAGILAQNYGLKFVKSLRKPVMTEHLDSLSDAIAGSTRSH